MKYPPEQVDRLAAEYVLGTLLGAARRRFESLMRNRADVRLAVSEWEGRLNGLAATIAPKKPPRYLWKQIRRQIQPMPRSDTWSRWLKGSLALPLVAAGVAWLAISLLPVASIDRVAVFADEGAQPLWSVSADVEQRQLILQTFAPPASGDARVYELWLLPAGASPVSLGVLAENAGLLEVGLTPSQIAAFSTSASVAISVEPSGGSPTGVPTGPVVYQAALVSL